MPIIYNVCMKFVLQLSDLNLCSDERRAVRNSNHGIILARFENLTETIAMAGVPIGTVEYCRQFMKLLGLNEPPHYSYPNELVQFLHRKIDVRDASEVPVGWFMKPYLLKTFDGQIKPESSDVVGKVYCGEPVKFTFEWRYYILNSKILGKSRYDDYDDECNAPDDYVCSIIKKFKNAPIGYSIDIGIMTNSYSSYAGPALVEINDGWALGYYRWGDMSENDYTKLVFERWQEICRDISNIQKDICTTE